MQLTFFTVVYGAELWQLRLQAKSMARFVDARDVEDIIVVVNDIDQREVRSEVENMLSAYGELASKVRVLDGDDFFGESPEKITSIRQALVESRLLAFMRRSKGWKGNKGHFMQQAFKLSAWRFAATENIVILDAKNVFTRAVNIDDYFDGPGARATLMEPGHLHRRWLEPSFRTLGLRFKPEHHLKERYTQFITPYAINRDVLRRVCCTFEEKYHPVQVAFGSKTRNTLVKRFFHYTEFMIINAWCFYQGSTPAREFREGIVEPDSFFPSTTTQKADAILAKLEEGETAVLGLHSSVMRRLSDEQIQRLRLHLSNIGVLKDSEELVGSLHANTV